jgi:alanine-glyoxylate transaminase / serine-glyoxylate transaminase / serine-pyruvate transaminase
MSDLDAGYLPGRHLVQVPGPTNIPPLVVEAMSRQTLDHRGPAFAALSNALFDRVKAVFKTEQPVVMFPGSGTGAWEACLENTCSPGDRVLSVETGQFAALWAQMARQLGLEVETIETDWRGPVDTEVLEARLSADQDHDIRAVLITHNETSTGVTSDIAAVRRALDNADHPALLFVDAVSSLASIDYRHDEWRVDVTIAASQKGLMMPPGLCFNAVSPRALSAAKTSELPCAFWRWEPVMEQNAHGFFPYTPPTNLLAGLEAALSMLDAEGLDAVFSRHRRHGAATRAAAEAWGLELQCRVPAAASPTVTALRMPEGHREEELRALVLSEYGMALGAGLGRLAGGVFRIGHLGDFDDLSLVGALAGIEMALGHSAIPHKPGGVTAAMAVLAASDTPTWQMRVDR